MKESRGQHSTPLTHFKAMTTQNFDAQTINEDDLEAVQGGCGINAIPNPFEFVPKPVGKLIVDVIDLVDKY